MVTITKNPDSFTFEVKGMHKLWAFKNQITIPTSHITGAFADNDKVHTWWKGIRLLGTYLPGVITAGTFYKDGERAFWDVSHPERCITVLLHHEEYKELIIEVEDVEAALLLFRREQEQLNGLIKI